MENRASNNLLWSILLFGLLFGGLAACGDSDHDSNQDMTLEQKESANQERLMGNQENTAQNQEETFNADLDGSSEVPEVETEAEGTVTATLMGDTLQVQGEFSDLSADYTASHIHMGGENENGDPIQPLKPDIGSDKTSGSWNASYMLNKKYIKALKAGNLYVNVHSANHQSGEIRGQLRSSEM